MKGNPASKALNIIAAVLGVVLVLGRSLGGSCRRSLEGSLSGLLRIAGGLVCHRSVLVAVERLEIGDGVFNVLSVDETHLDAVHLPCRDQP